MYTFAYRGSHGYATRFEQGWNGVASPASHEPLAFATPEEAMAAAERFAQDHQLGDQYAVIDLDRHTGVLFGQSGIGWYDFSLAHTPEKLSARAADDFGLPQPAHRWGEAQMQQHPAIITEYENIPFTDATTPSPDWMDQATVLAGQGLLMLGQAALIAVPAYLAARTMVPGRYAAGIAGAVAGGIVAAGALVSLGESEPIASGDDHAAAVDHAQSFVDDAGAADGLQGIG